MIKQRYAQRGNSLEAIPNERGSRLTNSRLRHPKIAITMKNKHKLRAFSINSEFDDNISIFSREANELEKPFSPPEDRFVFRSKSDVNDCRLNTPGFMINEKDSNTTENKRQGTTETRHTSSYTISTNGRGESGLRFRRINLSRISKVDHLLSQNDQSMFDPNDNLCPEVAHNKSAQESRKPKISSNRLGKIFSRHKRIESVLNGFDPPRFHKKKVVINRKN